MLKKLFNIKSDYVNVVPASKFIRSLLSEFNIEDCDGNEIEICIMESLNNVIKHSYKNENNFDIEIELTYDDGLTEISISDYGLPRKDKFIKEPRYNINDINDLPESGQGLFIIKQLTDETDYFSFEGKNTFIMKRKCKAKI